MSDEISAALKAHAAALTETMVNREMAAAVCQDLMETLGEITAQLEGLQNRIDDAMHDGVCVWQAGQQARERFAMHAMRALLSGHYGMNLRWEDRSKLLAQYAWHMADLMVEVGDRTTPVEPREPPPHEVR